ncbi:peptide chain release factor N(5)-glutamine methyltransferase [Catalinimonas niigatensis]|uniref:peptide chain release factor N(5)-glutamine methyltransferase n=1 Tax=Catalinimonas niigatensis TaxID=1397264 RepID=UPI002665C6B0|nr:peptide chain release factor N(5)-glutamine methyltransferase [Catalinimonas niigatensis]WPP48114.1 peptide chain release factor N(5)-glutamine methyltransferase [Catalinimonas niigatensis]
MKEKVYQARALYQSIVNQIYQHRSGLYAIEEARYMALMLMEHYLHQQRTDILLDRQLQMDNHQEKKLEVAVKRICNDEPIQYVIGETFFYGRSLYVSPAVLIPRRETEELVDLIIKENKTPALNILDIGTGSGCIAVTLCKEMDTPKVHALDVSQEALAVAKANAQRYQANVQWLFEDILNLSFSQENFDIIVSNPPYVKKSEAAEMKKNVLSYEPYEALFVSDEDPLLFYRQIAQLCTMSDMLKKGGKVYLEINEAHGAEVVKLFKEQGFHDVRLRKDMQQKDRFVSAKLTF